MAQAMVNFRMDSQLKNDMEIVCREMGLTPSAAYNLFAKKVTQERRIPFEITADPFYSDEHIDMLERRIADMKAGRNMHEHDLIEVE